MKRTSLNPVSTLPMHRILVAATAALLFTAGCASSQAAKTGDASASSGKSGKAGATASAAGPQDVSTRSKLLFEDAVKAFDAQTKARAFDYPGLERKFQAALDADPDLAEADYNLGVLAERQGKKAEAKARYQAALKKKPSLRQAAENLAVMAQNDGDVGGAVAMYQDLLQKFPDDAAGRARLAEVYRQQGDHDRAMEYARAALARDPGSVTAYKVMLRSSLERKQLSMAKLIALRATKLEQQDADLAYLSALIFLQESDTDGARVQLRRTLELDPGHVAARTHLAEMDLAAENYTGAEEHLRRLLQADGKNAAALVNLAVAYKGQGQYDKAMQALDEAEKVNPRLAALHFNRGVLLHRHKDAPERALELYKKYLSLEGGDVAVSAEDPVFNLIKEAEAIVQAKAEAARAEEEAKRMAALEAQNAAKSKAQDAAQPAAEPASAKAGEGAKVTPAATTQKPAQAQPAVAPAPKAPAPRPAPRDADEPEDAL